MAPSKHQSGRIKRWIVKDTVWNWKARRFIVRRDGQPFRFPIYR
jgi:hypothetical protein